MKQKTFNNWLLLSFIHLCNLFDNVYLWQYKKQDTQLLNTAKRNGYISVRSNCKNDYISKWNSKNIARELKDWFESISVISNHDDKLSDFKNKKYAKFSRNLNNGVVIVTSIGKLVSDNDQSEVNFKGWTKYLYTSNDQYHDGFYYGLLKGVNGTITGTYFVTSGL